MRAWKGIQELPPGDKRSFFTFAGYHGEPFRGAGWGNSSYWGGYCNHGNVLFPTWHRVYLFQLEEALRSIPGCAEVTLPFWDETSSETLKNGIPWALTNETFTFSDGTEILNPLASYRMPINIVDHLSPFPDANYSKPKGYETVRYPLSGLVGDLDKDATKAHNALYPNQAENVKTLNSNIVQWLNSTFVIGNDPVPVGGVYEKFRNCLDAPNYTVFSNTSSASAWNDNANQHVVALESPHNSIHLAVGGYEITGQADFSVIDGANGDMGENDTAAFDPIFFFHHCFIDRVFWLWQNRHGATDEIEIMAGYPGTNTVDNQGPTPGVAPNTWLTTSSPLDPFTLEENGIIRPYNSLDCINIERQLGYSYGPGSLEDVPPPSTEVIGEDVVAEKRIHVSGINRTQIRGSFLISAFATIDGKHQHIGTEAVLSRWHVNGCVNCQAHLLAKATFALPAEVHQSIAEKPLNTAVTVEVRTRDGLLGGRPKALAAAVADTVGKQEFRVEYR